MRRTRRSARVEGLHQPEAAHEKTKKADRELSGEANVGHAHVLDASDVRESRLTRLHHRDRLSRANAVAVAWSAQFNLAL